MDVITLAYLTLALPVVTLCYPDQWLHQIYVDNQTGVNDSSCWEGGYSTPCLSLNLALTGAQHLYNSIVIYLQPGQHQLRGGNETQLRNMSQLTIVGNGSQSEVVIGCDQLAGAGLAFFWSQGIELRNVSLVTCGAPQNSISKPDVYPQIQVAAILFANCNATKLTNVHIISSVGTGAVVYNPMGVVNITSCLFSLSGDQFEGGGLVIDVNEVTSQSSCIITNSTFTHNFNQLQAGGISVVFSGNVANNIVQLDEVHVKNNYGSGIILAFNDNANGNNVIINDAEVIENSGSSGGGVFVNIGSDSDSNGCPFGNIVTINSSRFISNVANIAGGGIAVETDCILYDYRYPTSKLQIENCVFGNNYAVHRSILYLSEILFEQNMTILVHNSTILPWHSVPVNNPYFIHAEFTLQGFVVSIPFECTWQGWVVFIFLQLVPLWIMMILLAVLHINITNGGLNGYILYSQLVSLQFPGLGYSSWVPGALFWRYWFLAIPLIVYSIWNLNFLTLYPPFCLPHVNTAAGVILLQYVTAACPLVFIIVTYTWIRWYNNGYRFVVYTTRPVHQLLARFWQKFKIQPSLIDTYVGLILLSYMRFLTVSAKLLQYIAIEVKTDILMDNNKNTAELVVLGIVAALCLLVFVVPPMVVLLFYHLKIFQRCLTWCKLDRPGLHALVDAYQGCFKNSATDDTEARYFAGLYLLFRFCYLVLIVVPSSVYAMHYYNDNNCYGNGLVSNLEFIPLSVYEACLSFVMAGLVVIIRPYKKNGHNVIDFLVLFFLTVIGILACIDLVSQILTAILIYLPFMFLLCYIIFRLLKRCCCACVALRRGNACQAIPGNEATPFPTERQPLLKPPTTSVVTMNDCAEDDGYADRMINPSRYNIQDEL